MSTKPLSSTLCPEKTRLLGEYVAALNLHSGDVNEYSAMMRERIDGDLLEIVRQRMHQSQKQVTVARKRYVAHLQEHRCDKPI